MNAPLAAVAGFLALALGGCAAVERSDDDVDVGALEISLERATGIDLGPAPEINLVPGIPSLASSRTGSRHGESLLMLEFYEESATKEALGGAERLGPTTAMRAENVVVLYTPAPGGEDRADLIGERIADARDV